MPYIIAISIVLVLFMLLRVKMEVINIDYQTAFYLRIGFLRLSLNYDALIEKVSPQALGFSNTVRMIKSYIDSYPALKSLVKKATLEELLVVKFVSTEYSVLDSITSALYFSSSNYLLLYLKELLKKCHKTYITINQDEKRKDFDFFIRASVSVGSILWVFITHPITVVKFINVQRELI